jgi:DNA-nicking Smr family endonuclease
MSKQPPSAKDIVLFRAVVKDVRPLKNDNKVQLKKNKRKTIKKKYLLLEPAEDYPFSEHTSETIAADTQLFFARPGLQHKLLRNLRQGQLPINARLDLHGMTTATARQAVSQFIEECLKHGYRYALIVHGKGSLSSSVTPVLKNHINNWLPQHPAVLAFCSAKAKDGGAGAVYVLLKHSF